MRANKEYLTCKAIAEYLRLQYPHVLFHYDLAGLNLSRAQSGMMKAIQGCKGWPDLMILHPSNGKVLFLEIKAEGTKLYKEKSEGFKTPHLTEQAETIRKIKDDNHEAMFAVGLDQALRQIKLFLNDENI